MLQERTREADIPYHGSFELTPLCNLDCKMCYVHLQDPSVKHRMLSGKQWLSIIQQAIDEGMHQTKNKLAQTIPMWQLECLPDEAAARLCHDTITNQGI